MVDKEVLRIKTCELYDLLSVKCVDIVSAHRLLGQVLYVIRYRHRLQIAETPESESLERWNLDDARANLDSTLQRLNLCELDKELVRYIANKTDFKVR